MAAIGRRSTCYCYCLLLLLFWWCGCSNCELSHCPNLCDCNGFTINCAARGLSEVPKDVPRGTQRLDLQENRISVIRRADFAGLENLRILQLSDNQIHSIEDGAFNELSGLERLRLNKNQLRSLPDRVFAYTPNLYRLDLSENFLTVLTSKMMEGPSRLKNLQLDKNYLTCIDDEILERQTELEILTLNLNNLTTIRYNVFEKMPNIRVLRLSENRWLCDCRLSWLSDVLRAHPRLGLNTRCHSPVYMKGRGLDTIDSDQMKCSGIEKRANRNCEQRSVCPPMCICTETTIDCRARGLTHVPPNLPLATTELRLEQNHIVYVPPRAFHTLKRLRRLDLSNNEITEVAPNAFDGLDALTSLVLYNNRLVELPKHAFKGLKSLQLLLLNANKLQCVRHETFHGLRNLNLLSLYDNELKSLANGIFDGLPYLQTLHLARNPLICDCNLKWLGEFLTQHPVETSGARCELPRRVARKRLATLDPARYRCKGSEEHVTKLSGQCIIDHPCPAQCECTGTIVDCSRRNLAEPPKRVPAFTTELLLNDNKIGNLKNGDYFEDLTNLRKLDLSRNYIRSMEQNTFSKMTKLEDLDVSGNELVEVSDQLFKENILLTNLNLSSNGLMCLLNTTFVHLSRLETLSLANNQLKCIMKDAFDKLEKLTSLNLDNNDFVCNCHIRWLGGYLRRRQTAQWATGVNGPQCSHPPATLRTPIAQLDTQLFTCTSNSENACLPGGKYCPLGCVCRGTIVRCSGSQLRTVPSALPIDTTELFLDNNHIDSIHAEQLDKLRFLTKLDLSNNKINVLENDTFANLTHLSTLIITYNKLQCLEERAFAGLTSLRILSLHGNDLSLLPAGAFHDLRSMSHIALGSNPLYCDCRLKWFNAWINKAYVEPGIARCSRPSTLAGQLVLTAATERFLCNEDVPKSVLAKCDVCVSEPCKNGARCLSGPTKTYRCICAPGYHGKNCEHQIDACYGEPCRNNATCKVHEQGRFSCHCAKGFEGDRCETNIDDCLGNECKNSAQCIDLVSDYACLCPPAYTGWDCGKKIEYCTKDFNPCKNGAVCTSDGLDYNCTCTSGFTGINCTENIDDCVGNLCRNSAVCQDQIDSYRCACRGGFSGRYCEIPPISNALYPKTSPCQQSNCENGFCFLREGSTDNDYVCKCSAGYSGERCETLDTVSIQQNDSYIAWEPWQMSSVGDTLGGNLTLTLTTEADEGVLFYYGDDSHIAAELYLGHIKLSYYVGNYPVSLMYSYVKVNDGVPHRLEFGPNGRVISLQVDNSQPRSVENRGKQDQFVLRSKQNLYIGGLPNDHHGPVQSRYHLKSTSSLIGCVKHVHLNGQRLNLVNSVARHHITAGCVGVEDPCKRHSCQHGSCEADTSRQSGYVCKCTNGWTGRSCTERKRKCVKEKYRDYIVQDGCRSRRKIKNAVCRGWCGDDCCRPVKMKRRKVRLSCPTGRVRQSIVTIIRKCDCSQQCSDYNEADSSLVRWPH